MKQEHDVRVRLCRLFETKNTKIYQVRAGWASDCSIEFESNIPIPVGSIIHITIEVGK